MSANPQRGRRPRFLYQSSTCDLINPPAHCMLESERIYNGLVNNFFC